MNTNGVVGVEESESDILAIRGEDQYRTVEDIIRRSRPSSVYYTLLLISAFIITGGILLGNSAIIIGGMLVAPVLTPVLLIGLGISTGEIASIKGAVVLLAKSTLIVIAGGTVLSFVFGAPDAAFILSDSLRTAALYFMVALAAGAAGTFALARKDVIEVMPGVAIAVSLVPPLALVGIGIGQFDMDLARFNFLVYLFNLFGIIVGSLVVFSLLQFYKTRTLVEQRTQEAEMQDNVKKSLENKSTR